MAASVYDFIPVVESQAGDRYVLGAETRFSDPHPPAFDCSELTQWGTARVGVYLPDGAANQWQYCKQKGTLLGSIKEGVETFGALLFRIGAEIGEPGHDHVAVSLGNGRTFEARGRAYGVNTFTALGRTWTAAARIPGLDYHAPPPTVTATTPKGARMPTDQDKLIHDALARANDETGRLCAHFGVAAAQATVAPDLLGQTETAAAQLESNLARLSQRVGA